MRKYLGYFFYFYDHLKYRVFVILLVTVLAGLMDGLGLAMFLPLLQMVADQGAVTTSDQMGNLSFLLEALQWLGLQITLNVVLLVIFVFFVLKGIFQFFGTYLNVVYRQYFIKKLRIDNILALSGMRYDRFVLADAGKIQNTLSGETQRVSVAYRMYMQMIRQLNMIAVYMFLAFLSNPGFAGLVLIGGVLTNFFFNFLFKRTKKLSRQLTKIYHSFQGFMIQHVAFFKYLKATGLIGNYANRLVQKVDEIEETQWKIGLLDGIMKGVREPLMVGVVVLVILFQVNVMGGSLALIILSILFFYRALTAVMLLQTNYNSFLEMSGSLENLTDFTAELHSNKEHSGSMAFEAFRSKIEFKDVSFAYSSDDYILSNINLELFRNETLAIVGESGSGKTTLMNVLSGLLVPIEGAMEIDGVDSRKYNISSFQNRIGYITQEPVIFDDTLFNNVTFWSPKTPQNRERFLEALRKAHMLDFMNEQGQKEDLRLGNNGINLSGGQKQRISIARELFKQVDFLFMDEATSALDSETERAIQENIDELRGLYTIVIIAHRLSTIKNADRVVMLDKGRIEQVGDYESLVRESALFKRMVELQEL